MDSKKKKYMPPCYRIYLTFNFNCVTKKIVAPYLYIKIFIGLCNKLHKFVEFQDAVLQAIL